MLPISLGIRIWNVIRKKRKIKERAGAQQKLAVTAGFKSWNWRSKSNPVAGSSTAGRFDSCFSFSLAKGNDDSRKRMRDSSSDTIDIHFLHIAYVDRRY